MSRRPVTVLLAALALVPATTALADQPAGQCHAVKLDFTPAPEDFQPQIVAWLEDGSGNFLATVFITQQTGRYGMGNPPGRYVRAATP